MRKKLILDLDTGIDDALAIAYALGSADEIDLIGITATYGNVAVPLAARNALAVLHLFGRDDVPVYPGVDHPIAPATLPKMRGTTPDERAQAYARWQNGGADGWQTDASWSPTPGSVAVHHPNGIGGAIIPDSPRAPEAPGSAVDFIITAAREYGPDLTIVPTGAMTTMATSSTGMGISCSVRSMDALPALFMPCMACLKVRTIRGKLLIRLMIPPVATAPAPMYLT